MYIVVEKDLVGKRCPVVVTMMLSAIGFLFVYQGKQTDIATNICIHVCNRATYTCTCIICIDTCL